MSHIRILALSGLVMLAACGSSQPLGINGLWTGELNNSDGTLNIEFTTNLTQGGGTALTVTNFGIMSSCFNSPTSEMATFTATGNSNGIVTGAFAMTISTIFPGGLNNVATLQGNRDSATGNISGTWTLTGQSGCTGNGLLSMSQPPRV